MSETGGNSQEGEPSTASSSSFVPAANLYTDFASDSIPAPTQPVQSSMVSVNQTTRETQEKPDKNNEEKPKKPNRKDWIDTENPLHCKPCNFIAQNIEDFQDHSLSYRHIKKTAEVLEMKVNPNKDKEKTKQTSFTCEICVCSCNSESAWNSHLVGQKHRKNLEKQGAAKMFLKQKMKFGMEQGGGPLLNKAPPLHGYKPYQRPQHTPHPSYSMPTNPGAQCANDFTQYKEPLIGLEYVTEIQVTGQNPRYHCELCDAKFDHNIKFPHLVGAKHRFNVLKEKNPAIAQEIRLGVKKRSELTGKLLDEARKIEAQEGRKHVKTCIEASPFDNDTNTVKQEAVMVGSPPYSANKGGSGRGLAAPSRPYQSIRGHPLKGSYQNRGGQKRPHFPNQFDSTPQTYGNPNQPYSSNMPSFGTEPPPFQAFQMRGRGGRGRGFRGANQGGRGYNNSNRQNEQAQNAAFVGTHPQHNPGGFGRGYNNRNRQNEQVQNASSMGPRPQYNPGGFGRGYNNKQSRQGPWVTSTNTYQQKIPGSWNNIPYNNSTSGRLLPREAFAPSTAAAALPNYNKQMSANTNPQNSNSGQSETVQPHKQNDSQPTTTKSSPQTETRPKESTQDLLKGLTDLGKLVSSEEDASIALQVSNALTQALLNYRMQNIKEESN